MPEAAFFDKSRIQHWPMRFYSIVSLSTNQGICEISNKRYLMVKVLGPRTLTDKEQFIAARVVGWRSWSTLR